MCQDNGNHKKQKGQKQYKPKKGISLNPLQFDEAVADILKVKPQPKEEEKQKEENK